MWNTFGISVLRNQLMRSCLLPYEIISKDEVITVDENPGNIAAEGSDMTIHMRMKARLTEFLALR